MERGEQIMKKQQTKMCCLAAAVMFGFVLSACGSTDDVAGDDWRTSGVVAGSGTITHDGKSVDVLVTVSETSAAFYWDEPEQVLYDSVLFPMHVPDAEQAFNAISFDDMAMGKVMCWSASLMNMEIIQS